MSDVKSDAREFVGSGRDEAIRKACQYFGVDEQSALVISGFKPGTVYGLATRAVIVAVPKGRAGSAPARARSDSGRRDEEERGNSGRGAGRDSSRRRDRGRGDRARESSSSAREEREPSSRGRGDREFSSSPREERESSSSAREEREPSSRGRGDREFSSSPREERESSSSAREEREPSSRPSKEAKPQGDRERARRPEFDEAKPAARSSTGTAARELGEIGQFLSGTIERMGLGSFEISESKEGEIIALQLKGAAAETLSSGQGRTVDALQLLVNQVSARVSPDRQRVVIDVEGDTDAREEFLEKLAERVASRALQTGRPVALDPMNSRDRRLIHVALRDRDDVATISEGEGRYRQVVVVPESSDEFEDARAQSERSSSDR